MEKSIEKANAEIVKRKLAVELKQLDFKRTKPTFYTRLLEDRIEFIHLHKFTFGPSIRVHTGIRFFVDDFEAVSLNGIDSDGLRKYNLTYHKSQESIEKCVKEIYVFIQNESIPWLEKWRKDRELKKNLSSPLTKEIIINYEKYIDGLRDESIMNLINQSKKLLGIKV